MLEGNIEAADFGQCFDMNEFHCLIDALPFMWSGRNHWFMDRRDKTWDLFTPFCEAWCDKMQALFSTYSLGIMDESMIPWVPKTSKLGGLPNYTYEPRKPKGLGTMLKDTAEVVTGILLFCDPVMAPTVQDKKQFALKKSHLPSDPNNAVHPPHVAEALRQAYYSNLKDGDWVGGNAWFGSVAACLALNLEPIIHKDE